MSSLQVVNAVAVVIICLCLVNCVCACSGDGVGVGLIRNRCALETLHKFKVHCHFGIIISTFMDGIGYSMLRNQ